MTKPKPKAAATAAPKPAAKPAEGLPPTGPAAVKRPAAVDGRQPAAVVADGRCAARNGSGERCIYQAHEGGLHALDAARYFA